jgi:hypothetical protein
MRLISEIAPVTGKRKHLRDACELSSSTGNRWPSRRRLKETNRPAQPFGPNGTIERDAAV